MSYKPVLPSSLLSQQGSKENGSFNHRFNNYALRTGVIIKVHEIDSENNVNNLGPEYDVAVIEQDEDRGVTSTIYRNCTSIDQFGGVSDFMEVKYTAATNEDYKSKQDPEDTNGAMVTILCLDGISSKGIIIGGVKHTKRESNLTKENGKHLEGEFNGLNWKIDKDGALTIKFQSASDNDGKYADEEAGGSFATITKEGSFDLNTGDDKNYIRIDKPNNDIGLKSDNDIGATAKNDIGFNAGKNLNLRAKKDLIASAEGKAAFTIKSTLDIKADAPMTIGTPQLQIDASNGMLVKSAQIILDAPLVVVGAGATPAIVLQTQFQGIGNLGGPVISTAIGPFSGSVQIGV